jgi:hypothetical protein
MISKTNCKGANVEFSISKHLGFTDEEIVKTFAEEESFELPPRSRKIRSEILRSKETHPLQ